MKILFTIILLASIAVLQSQVLIPIKTKDRTNISQIKLSSIGQFGLARKARTNVPAHLHTGIDILRPNGNYIKPVYPVAEGVVISKRTDGPYAQLIIEHKLNGLTFWTLYEHIAGITVNVKDKVKTSNPVARFMNWEEIDKYGKQFDHFHLEILKVAPQKIKPDKLHPERNYNAYSLTCYTQSDLQKYYFNPLDFLQKYLVK